ncbi:hypothetical protein ACFWAR_10195 [Streptomyces sp. NPDC059917]|uniref:hypothetical protein n=1 Tax=Streptomyces sp. NPDC059917 TaxID=3347002 RepID=UPI00364EF1AF
MTVLPYLEVTAASYAASYTTGLRVTGTADGAVLSGACPRCACPFDFSYVRRVYRHRPAGGRAADVLQVPVLCVCETAHAGRPADEEGCGAYWNILLERTAP